MHADVFASEVAAAMGRLEYTNGEDLVQDTYFLMSEFYKEHVGQEISLLALAECISRSTTVSFIEKSGRTDPLIAFEVAILLPVALSRARTEFIIDRIMHGGNPTIGGEIAENLSVLAKASFAFNRKYLNGKSMSDIASSLQDINRLSETVLGGELTDKILLQFGYPQEVIDDPYGFE